MDARLAEVKQRVILLSAIDRDRQVFGASHHQYKLAPTLDSQELGELQAALGTDLPFEVCAFLKQVASSGAGPYYGLRPLAIHDRRGMLMIADQGCGMSSLLAIDGPHRGAIWADHDGHLEEESPSFLTWYEKWIEGAFIEWAERAAPCLALDGPSKPEELEGASVAFDILAAIEKPTMSQARALGYLHLRERRYDDANAAFVRASRAPELHSDLLPSERKARLHRDRANLEYVRDDFDAAMREANAGLAINNIWFSTSDELREVLERALHGAGRADEALAILEQRAAEAFFDFALHHRLATEYLARGDVKAAIGALERAAHMPNIGGPNATPDSRVSSAFEPIIAALRAGGRTADADALAERADVLLHAN